MTLKPAAERIATFKLKLNPDDQGNSSLRRDWWKAEGIYLSNVCLAVHLQPCSPPGIGWKPEAAKEELYAFLRGLGHTAMKHDLMRPVAGVTLESYYKDYGSHVLKSVQNWGADQEWHRGSFAFYIEQENADDKDPLATRLADLLEPTPKVLENYEPKDPRDTDLILIEIKKNISNSLGLEEITKDTATLALDLQNALSQWAHEEQRDLEKSALNSWVDQITRRADRLVDGGEA